MKGQFGSRELLALATCGLCLWLAGRPQAATAQSRFVGGAPSRSDVEVRPSRLRFEPGARSNWHSHGNFQIIMAEEGAGRTQVRGEPLQKLEVGSPVYAAAGVVHWHGAAPDEYLVQLTFSSGETSWY
ncbi:MAG: cupin domain-containing protein, partial [Vicinamibacterales bacterium]|nr:cupin domain-containing protein [Vicinamibacterales bacterium]